MSNRSERRAAERTAHKANRTQNATLARPVSAGRTMVAAASADLHFELATADLLERPMAGASPRASEAQINANRENAKLSTGPTTDAGKETVSQNRRTHGLIGRFQLHGEECSEDYRHLIEEIYTEYEPQSATERRLANSLIQHYWLMQRAIRLQGEVLGEDDKKLSLYMRYQSTHERSYYKAQKELKASVKERVKLKNGFEQQTRKDELTEARTRLAHAKAQQVEIDTACRQVMDAPIPGHERIGFEQLTKACSEAIATLVYKTQTAQAAA